MEKACTFDSRTFDPYLKEANSVIDSVINNALEIHEKYLIETNSSSSKIAEEQELQTRGGNDVAPNIEWLTGKDFTVDAGRSKIDEFIKTWKRDESWLYCIDFLGQEEHDCDIRYRYRVMWSVPTRRKPIPRATASIYFTMKISKYKPKSCPIDVYYVFETSSLVHRPGHSRFQQKWLKDIIESKIMLTEDIKF